MNAMIHNTAWVPAHFHLIFGGTKPITVHYELGVELVAAAARYNPFEAPDYTYRAAIEHLRTARDLLKRPDD